jgi:putative transcriptional regulator
MEPIEAARAKRLDMKLSQAAFAERFGLVLVTYKQWERGSRKPDTASNVLLDTIVAFPDAVARAVKDRAQKNIR